MGRGLKQLIKEIVKESVREVLGEEGLINTNKRTFRVPGVSSEFLEDTDEEFINKVLKLQIFRTRKPTPLGVG